MNQNIITAIISAGIGAIGTIAGWLIGKKKRTAEIDKDESEVKKNEEEVREKRILNLSTSIDVYEKVFAELKEQLQTVSDKCSALSKEIEELRKENVSLKEEVHQLREQLKQKINK